MCKIKDSLTGMAQDKAGVYCPIVYLECCYCGSGQTAFTEVSPFCTDCCNPLHRQVLTNSFTICDRCNVAIRGQLPKPYCIACQSVVGLYDY